MRASWDAAYAVETWWDPTVTVEGWYDDELTADAASGGGTPSLTGHTEGDSGTGASTYDLSITIPASQSILIVAQGFVPTVTSTSVTLDPAGANLALTAVGASVTSSATSTGRGVRLWYLVNPPAGTWTLRGVLSGVVLQTLSASWWTNVDTTTPFGTQVTNSATTGTSISVSTGSVPFFISALGLRSTSAPTPGGSQTTVSGHQSSTNQQWYVSSQTSGSTASWSWSTSDENALVGVELKGVASGDATFTATVGGDSADGGSASFAASSTFTGAVGGDNASGASASLTGTATFTGALGGDAAAGGSASFTASSTFAGVAGGDTGDGGSASFTASSTFTTQVGGDTASGASASFTGTSPDATFSTTAGGDAADGSAASFTGTGTFTGAPGGDAADGSTASLTASSAFTANAGGDTANGGSASLTGSATFSGTVGGDSASGAAASFTVTGDATFTATAGGDAADGGTASLTASSTFTGSAGGDTGTGSAASFTGSGTFSTLVATADADGNVALMAGSATFATLDSTSTAEGATVSFVLELPPESGRAEGASPATPGIRHDNPAAATVGAAPATASSTTGGDGTAPAVVGAAPTTPRAGG